MTLETNDEAVDLSRRSMMSRLGLVASVAIVAPVLMTMSTSALASHKDKAWTDLKRKNVGTGKGTGAATSATQSNGDSNASGGTDDPDGDPPICDSLWGCG